MIKTKIQALARAAQRESELTAALNEIRDFLPVPPRAGVLRDLYIETLGHPEAVPAYVRAHLQAEAEAEKVRRDAGLRRRLDDPPLAQDEISTNLAA